MNTAPDPKIKSLNSLTKNDPCGPAKAFPLCSLPVTSSQRPLSCAQRGELRAKRRFAAPNGGGRAIARSQLSQRDLLVQRLRSGSHCILQTFAHSRTFLGHRLGSLQVPGENLFPAC